LFRFGYGSELRRRFGKAQKEDPGNRIKMEMKAKQSVITLIFAALVAVLTGCPGKQKGHSQEALAMLALNGAALPGTTARPVVPNTAIVTWAQLDVAVGCGTVGCHPNAKLAYSAVDFKTALANVCTPANAKTNILVRSTSPGGNMYLLAVQLGQPIPAAEVNAIAGWVYNGCQP